MDLTKVLTEEEMNANKALFIAYLRETKREGIEKLIEWLENSDFFYAPNSTDYKGNFSGGLCQHCLNVLTAARTMKEKLSNLGTAPMSYANVDDTSLTIVALLHDVCKVNFYTPTIKYTKDEGSPNWKHYISYTIDDKFPCGHSQKSLVLLMQFIKLTSQEILGIQWHMGMTHSEVYLSPIDRTSYYAAMTNNPIVPLIVEANAFATCMMDRHIDQKATATY